MTADRQEIIAVLDLHWVGQMHTNDWPSYREVLADALMALPDVDRPQLEVALKAAYQQGFHDARYYPHRHQPPLTVEWDEQATVVPRWPAPSWRAGVELPMPVFCDNQEVPD